MKLAAFIARIKFIGILIAAAWAIAFLIVVTGLDRYRERPQYNTINHRCLDIACIQRGIR